MSAQPTLAPQTGWSLTSHIPAWATTPSAPTRKLRGVFFMSRPPLLTRRGLRSPKKRFEKTRS